MNNVKLDTSGNKIPRDAINFQLYDLAKKSGGYPNEIVRQVAIEYINKEYGVSITLGHDGIIDPVEYRKTIEIEINIATRLDSQVLTNMFQDIDARKITHGKMREIIEEKIDDVNGFNPYFHHLEQQMIDHSLRDNTVETRLVFFPRKE